MIHKIEVEKGDTVITDIVLNQHQPEGWYEYIPQVGDKITVVFSDSTGKSVKTINVEITDSEVKRVSVNMPADLKAGRYTYSVTLSCPVDGTTETYTVCENNIFVVKEDK